MGGQADGLGVLKHRPASAPAARRLGVDRPNALVQAVVVTNGRLGAAQELTQQVVGLSVEDALATPFLALGTHDEIAEHLLACGRRWGISYVTVRELEAFAPVIERLKHADAAALT
jgi:hypothetical protein